MRKIVVAEFISLDGVIEGPGPEDDFAYAGWTMPYFNDDIGNAIADVASRSDTMLLGRRTWQGFASSFSTQTDGMAAFLNNIPKYVVSTTLKTADWNHSTLISANIVEEITKLKQQPGKDIVLNGSATLAHTLQKHNLVDEYSLILYPVVVGTGKRLFVEGSPATLRLVSTRALDSGVVLLTYQSHSKA
ncbi:MAG: dihydrofolate reductase family protein [Chloroflexota bacterium]